MLYLVHAYNPTTFQWYDIGLYTGLMIKSWDKSLCIPSVCGMYTQPKSEIVKPKIHVSLIRSAFFKKNVINLLNEFQALSPVDFCNGCGIHVKYTWKDILKKLIRFDFRFRCNMYDNRCLWTDLDDNSNMLIKLDEKE